LVVAPASHCAIAVRNTSRGQPLI